MKMVSYGLLSGFSLALPILAASHTYSLFGLVTTPKLGEARCRLLHQALKDVCWEETVGTALNQRIGPLLYWHLREYGLRYPINVRRALGTLYARQKAIAAAQTQTLTEILAAFRAAKIEAVVLKGGALAHVVYAEPGLRPMEDLDVLVSLENGDNARHILCTLGFHAPAPVTRYEKLQHHLPVAQRLTAGVVVSVEIHTTAFNLLMSDPLSLGNLEKPLVEYKLGDETASALAPIQLLWMQYHGLRKLAEPLRYLQLADLVGILEHYANQLDWSRLRKQHPDLWYAFAALHAFTPLNDEVCKHVGLDPERPVAMVGVGHDYCGWPLRSFTGNQSFRARWALLADTLLPTEWWSRFVYGIPVKRSLAEVFLYRHPAAFLRQGLRRLYLGPVAPGTFFKVPI